MSPGSIMPPYPWLITDDLDISDTEAKIRVLQQLGTPYPAGFAQRANEDLREQAAQIVKNLRQDGIKGEALEQKEIIALIAYLQRLGTDIKKMDRPSASN